MADATDSKSVFERSAGSSPASGTKFARTTFGRRPGSGGFESLLKTVDGEAISLVCTPQGRADEMTEAFVTMESLGIARHPLLDLGDAVELIAHHLRVNLSGPEQNLCETAQPDLTVLQPSSTEVTSGSGLRRGWLRSGRLGRCRGLRGGRFASRAIRRWRRA
jgi:hypothetical protein